MDEWEHVRYGSRHVSSPERLRDDLDRTLAEISQIRDYIDFCCARGRSPPDHSYRDLDILQSRYDQLSLALSESRQAFASSRRGRSPVIASSRVPSPIDAPCPPRPDSSSLRGPRLSPQPGPSSQDRRRPRDASSDLPRHSRLPEERYRGRFAYSTDCSDSRRRHSRESPSPKPMGVASRGSPSPMRMGFASRGSPSPKGMGFTSRVSPSLERMGVTSRGSPSPKRMGFASRVSPSLERMGFASRGSPSPKRMGFASRVSPSLKRKEFASRESPSTKRQRFAFASRDSASPRRQHSSRASSGDDSFERAHRGLLLHVHLPLQEKIRKLMKPLCQLRLRL